MKDQVKIKIVGSYYYSPNDIIGSGSWGTVYKAFQAQDETNPSASKKAYALKRINKYKIQSSQSSFEKYQSQVIALQKAKNIKEIIRFVDFFKSKSHYYIITQYQEGAINLYSYLEMHSNKFTETQARTIWDIILTAVDQLHSINICHRDLKLQNILYHPESHTAKIIDLGLAVCFPKPEHFQLNKAGSPLFMAPQVLLQMKYTIKCDIWSLGIIFYFMLFRISPYGQNPTIKGIENGMNNIKEKGIKYPQKPRISNNCKQVIQSCLRWQQQDRISIKQIKSLPFFKKPIISNRQILDKQLIFQAKYDN